MKRFLAFFLALTLCAACLTARAKALKTASAMWWEFFPAS